MAVGVDRSVLEDILKECPRFRILTSGKGIEKTGVGKTTLIKETFNIDSLKASDTEPGKCDIEEEIYSSQNDLFVLHDSQGFEPGEVDNFNKVKRFIDQRTQMPLIKDRLHAIWLCIQIPRTGGRLIEAGDEEFLKLPFGDLPVVIVFTQYDKLINQFHYNLAPSKEFNAKNPEEKKRQIEEESRRYFQARCVEPLEKIHDEHRPKRLKWVWVSNHRDTLQELIRVTLELVQNHVQESTWIVMAAAQRVNADANVKSCIAVGMKKYWRGLAAGTYFSDRRLAACIGVINTEIVQIWNFRDDDQILLRPSFQNAVLLLVQDLADPNGPSAGSDVTNNLDAINSALSVVTPISGPLAPVVASVGLSVMFAKWLSDMYASTPGVLRCLMGYIIDVTIVLEVLFWLKIGQPRLPSLSEDDIIAAFGMYQGTSSHLEVHSEIRRYVDNMTLLDHVKPDDKTHLEVERLINAHRRVLIDTIFADARRQPERPQSPPPPPSTSRVPEPQLNAVPEASGSQPPPQRHRGPKTPSPTRSSGKKAKSWVSSVGRLLKKSGRKSP
ncbi:hypothetical protein HYPSUDRAFT_205864 [Hypholoma sublateritium FD-334 SS-4]|uniref:G domain-containing protein n=1 Tax=Hypholoma sublateritium (strain FD-334 SS-4) TaxID=945553 RepID=A0A0D2KTD6_HYPSF|nr:hypothetical protein HYPSUDRAFT_205864 [Hypholoma sublateritium FD-334 SS-4]